MRVKVGGIRLSPDWAQINLTGPMGAKALLYAYLEGLAGRSINVPFLAFSGLGDQTLASLCVALADLPAAENAALALPGLRDRLTSLAPVNAVSIYPYRSRGFFLGRMLAVYARREIPVLAVGSSISTLTFVLGRRNLPQALKALDEQIELPANHAPLRWEVQVTQREPL